MPYLMRNNKVDRIGSNSQLVDYIKIYYHQDKWVKETKEKLSTNKESFKLILERLGLKLIE